MNFRRLNISPQKECAFLQITEEMFMEGLTELLEIDKKLGPWICLIPHLYIRPYIFALDEYIGIRPSDNYKFMIFTCPVGAYYSKPLKVKIETESTAGQCREARDMPKQPAIMPDRYIRPKLAQEKGYDQLIWTDGATHQYIEEAGTMNVMFMKGNKTDHC